MTDRPHRGSIYLIDAPIISQITHPGRQYILRVSAPACARTARPGSFAHIACDTGPLMRRPLSIMRASAEEGWLEFLYKPMGSGLSKLATRSPGETVNLLAPIGNGFDPDPSRPTLIAIGGGVGIPPMVFLAERLRADPRFNVVVFMGSEVPFPFELTVGRDMKGAPDASRASLALLEGWGVQSWLASNAGLEGCYPGLVTELADLWLAHQTPQTIQGAQIVGCGPSAMLRATAALAQKFALPCQLALEEYMACGVGGCAGCNVLIHTPTGPAMKRVCVDGPVFDASQVFPQRLGNQAEAR